MRPTRWKDADASTKRNPVARPTETSFAEKGKQIAEINADDSPACSPRLRDRQLIRAWNADALAKRRLAAGLLSLESYPLGFSSGTVSPKWRIAGCERALGPFTESVPAVF